MNDRNLVRGLFLMAIALSFGVTALTYPIGDFARAGPGLFPVVISTMLLLIGVATVVRSRFVPKVPLDLHLRNISLVVGSLIAFAVVSMYINMITGIVVMVFMSTLAGSTYSWKRNVKIAIGQIIMAYVLVKLLGMNLPL